MLELPVVSDDKKRARKPDWLRVKLPIGEEYRNVRRLVDEYGLHTICQS
ncbi:MAG: lipoyl synthase, partial [Saprospiraceae bacterium]